MLEQFHFIHPAWLLAALPLALLAALACRPAAGGNPWRRVVDARLLPLLMSGSGRASDRTVWWLVSAGWLVAIVALADPTWQRKPQPVFQTGAARVIVLDLAQTMNDADLKPSRLARARYKVEDVLAQAGEGQTGLVVYSGDAFTVAPLTRDANTIRSLLKVLEPDLMPSPGSRADLGLLRAGELLRQAGETTGDILLIADGVEPGRIADAQRAAARLGREGYRVSVLGVGTPAGVPLTDDQGRLVRGPAGELRAPGMDEAALRSLAQAGGGRYQAITDSGAGLQALLDDATAVPAKRAAQVKGVAPAWQELGPAIAVLLLPLAALAFRRNWLVSAALVGAMAATSSGAMAATWSDAWQRPDQQAAHALSAGDYAAAAKVAADPGRRGSAQYKLGNYALALENFSQEQGADADYNRGNALARLGRYTEAVAAYDKAIVEAPSNADAKANKAAVEAMMKQAQQPKQAGQPSQPGQGQPQAGSKSGSTSTSPSATGKDDKGGKGGKGDKGQENTSGASSKPGHADQSGSASGSNANTGKPQAAPSDGRSAAANGADASKPSAAADNPAGQAAPASSKPNSAAPANAFAQALDKLAHWAGGKSDNAAPATPAPAAAGALASNPARPATPPGTAAPRPGAAAGDDEHPLDSEEKLAAQQWLARIPDDPGGLLRRKFLYQYRQRAQQADAGNE
jgi:Ca-activated chloride channel family protein